MSVKIRQFGGHTSSYAGDCAVVTIDNGIHSEIIVIDTGSSKVWGLKELTNYVKGQLPSSAVRPVTLVSTHFHVDHYNMANLSSNIVNTHIYSAQAALNAGVQGDNGHKKIGLAGGLQEYRDAATGCGVTFIVPAGGKSDDQNDQSMAVYISAPGFSFLSFGDMTKDAYRRVVMQVGALPRATVTKYPHHGNYPNNYLDYYNSSLFSTGVLISGNSGSDVNKTIASLLANGVGAVYCLARTKEAKDMFELSWKFADQPVYICRDVDITEHGVSVLANATYMTEAKTNMGSRSKMTNQWKPVVENWTDADSDMDIS